MRLLSSTWFLASSFALQASATYVLSQDYTGANFYEGFQFFTQADPTDGHVQFLSMTEANSSQIAGLIDGGNASMAVYLGVDSQNDAPDGRGSLRVSSTQTFQHGLFIADIAHMPGGICGVWPAFWMLGPNWPLDGEIDIIEGVNDMTTNSMTLHTSAGVVVQNSTSAIAGVMTTSNCDVNASGQDQNVGCQVIADSDLTFGVGFNSANGGVYATEWTSDFIKIWFFPRGSIPSDITAGSPSPGAAWGNPASWFQSGSSMDAHFQDMNIVFDTTFCGVWAGAVWNTSSCASLAPTCEAYVTSTPAAFKNAYWAINSLQVFEDNGSNETTSVSQTEVKVQFESQNSFGHRVKKSEDSLLAG